MSDFKYTICSSILATCNRLFKYINTCVNTVYDEVEPIFVNNSTTIHNILNLTKGKQRKNNNISVIEIDQNFSAKKISFKDIKFRKVSNYVKNNKFNSNIDLDNTIAGLSGIT